MMNMRKLISIILPNFYDFFTLLMIGYAWFLHSNSQLKVSFGLACLFIYIATRVGILAGEIIRLMIGSSSIEEENMEEPADVVAKRMVLGFGPQTICVIICQVIVALCFLQGPATAKMTTPNAFVEPQEQQTEVVGETSPVADATNLNLEKPAVTAVEPAVKEDESEVVPVATSRPFRRSYKAAQPKVAEIPTNEQTVANTKSNVYYNIPDKTLKTAGVSPEARRVAYANAMTNIAPAAMVNTAAGNWSFSAPANTARIAQNTVPVNQQYQQPVQQVSTPGSTANTKRYPGDDNPVNVHWGYYRYAESIPGSRAQGNNTNYSTVPVPYTRW